MTDERLWQLLRVAARNTLRYRLQTGLIVLATLSGTAGVIVSAGYAAGGRQKITDQLARLGTNVLTVTPAQSKSVGGRARTGATVTTLNAGDYLVLRQTLPSIATSAATVSAVLRLRAGNLTKSAGVVGCEAGYFTIKHWSTSEGSPFDEEAERRQSRVALLGSTVSRQLFGDSDPTGARILINRIPFVVAGVLTERGQGLDAADEDDQVYVPLQTAMHRLMNVDFFNSIVLSLDSWSKMDEASQETRLLLARRHQVPEGGAADFVVQNQKSLLDTQLASFARLTFLIEWIAASALAVSSVGVFALAWLSIRNRTREIGTRRAIGATRSDVLLQFVGESSIACVGGCSAGLVVSYLALELVSRQAGQPFLYSSSAALAEAGGSVLLYSCFSLISSLRAIRIQPIVALRAE
ncbi:MAG TPA: ABC transporter permease [Acidisarcina sp.]